MREIKFRIWDKSEGYWLEGLSIHLHCSGRLLNIPPTLVIQEWIGLIDRSGTDIYEGDIVTCEGFGGSYEVVKDGCCFVGEQIESTQTIDLEMQEVKIIGNIYEDPHLIEE